MNKVQAVEIPLRCRCNHVRGIASDVSPSSGLRFVCYCKDCQAFARILGRANDVLDASGGTDIFHMPIAHVRLASGTDALRCLRLSFKTRVLRWYTDCCKTPIGNTADRPWFPIAAVIHSFADHGGQGRSRDVVLGPSICRIHEGSALHPLSPNGPPRPSPRIVALRGVKLIGWWLRGWNRPTPFFDDHTKAPISVPRVLSPGERATLDESPW